MPTLSRMFVNEGMRAGIPGKHEVHVLLVNRNGDILWRTTGQFDETKGESLLGAIEANR